MPSFEFKDYTLDLTIAGNEFQVNCVSELFDKVRAHRDTLIEMGRQIAAKEKSVDDAVTLCQKITDDILGNDAFARIFDKRIPTVTDCTDVLLFVIGSITEKVKENMGINGL